MAPPNLFHSSNASSSSSGPRTMGRVHSKMLRITRSNRPIDMLEDIGLPSKGDSRLLDHKTQEIFYTTIVERYMAFCADAGTRHELLRRFSALDITDDTQPPPAPQQQQQQKTPDSPSPTDFRSLQSIIFALRKLREAIVASNRIDPFAIQAYIFCIHFGVLVQHPPTYYPAILYALRSFRHSLTSIEFKEITAYLVLDAACRRQNLAEAFELKVKLRLEDKEVDQVLSALAHDNYIAFRRALQEMEGHKARLAQLADQDMMVVTLKAFKAYHQLDIASVERWTGRSWQQLVDFGVGWKLEGTTVFIRTPRQ